MTLDLNACAPLVEPTLLRQIVRVESGGNPYAIGVVGGRLARQPANLQEAVATARSLERNGWNYSIGAGQINRVHFARFGWSDPRAGFDSCANLAASQQVLRECYARALKRGFPPPGSGTTYSATHAALSCYYSGDLTRGARLGYVDKVLGGGRTAHRAAAKSKPTSMFLQ